MEAVQNAKKKMSSPSLTEGLALIESASISIQKSMHHVPLKEIEDAKKSFDFYAQVSNDFALANLGDTPNNQTLRANLDVALRKAKEEYESMKSEWDKATHCNHCIQEAIASLDITKSLFTKAFEDVAVDKDAVSEINQVLPAQDVDLSNSDATDVAVVDMAAADPPAADLPATDVAVVNMDLDLTTTSTLSSQNSVDQAAKELLPRLEPIPQELEDDVGKLILDPVYYYQRYCRKNLPRQVSFGTSVYEPGKIIKVFFTTNEILKMGSLNAVQADMNSQAACIPSDRSTYHHYIIYRSVSFQSLWLMEHFEQFRHALTIQLFGCRYVCWRTIVTIVLPAFRKFHHMPHIRLLHYIDSTPSTIGKIHGLDFTILYLYLFEMVNAHMITVDNIIKQIEDKAYLFDQFKDMYPDLQGYLMHRYKLPFDLLEMAESFDIKDHKPKEQGAALRLNGFDLNTPAGQWQQMFENLYRHLKSKTVDASWYKTGSLIICERCGRALPALFSFDKNVLKPGDNHEDPHPICRMCQLVPTCNGLLATAVYAYVPTTLQDAKDKRKPALEDGDPHKPVAPEDVDLSTWVLPESTGQCHWSAASMQVEQHLRYEATLFSPIHVMRRSPQRENLPPVPPKIRKSKTRFRRKQTTRRHRNGVPY